MPELPEVEHVARALRSLVLGRRILAAELLRPRLAPSITPSAFAASLKGASIECVGRRGKYLLLELTNALVLIAHLRMTGRLMLVPSRTTFPRFTHAVFHLDNGQALIFVDQRHFGMMKIVPSALLGETRELASLAPEPLSHEFTVEYLRDTLSRSRRTLKETLIDQRKVSGLGNIYTCEVLFEARVNPFNISADFSRRRVGRLHRTVQNVLGRAVAYSSKVPVDPENIDGGFYWGGNDAHWAVYDREGEPCIICKRKIRRISHAGRSTYFCPRCQRR